MIEQAYGTVAAERRGAYDAPAPESPPTLADGAALMSRLAGVAARLHAAQVEMVSVLDEVRRARAVEPIEGLPLDLYLAVEHRMTSGERWMLLAASEVLSVMPVSAGLFADGTLSWSQVRDLVARARRLPVASRRELDGMVAASLDVVDRLDPDQLRWAVDRACEDLEGRARKERAEDRDEGEDFVAVQLGLDGGSRLYGRLGPAATATTLGALDRRAAEDHPHAETKAQGRARALIDLAAEDLAGGCCCPDHTDHPGDDDLDDTTVARDGHAAETTDAAETARAGETGDGSRRCRRRTAHPLLTAHVPLDRITVTAAGLLEVDVPGWLPTLSARLVDALAASADVRAVVFDGKRPLCATRVVRAGDVTDKTREAVRARDLGDRTPGSAVAVTSTQLHHTDRKGRGHHPEYLVSLSRRGHLRVVHRHGWKVEVDGDTGDTLWSREGRTIRTAPHGTPLRRPPPTDGDDAAGARAGPTADEER